MKKELWGHGMGRHRREEIYGIGRRDIAAIAGFIGDKPWFMGEQPSSLDATAYAFLANILWVPLESSLRAAATEHPHLETYCRRMQENYFAAGEG
ncbi:MAG: glutathione S-transferase C-terminal domain-containing protein [Betaproteobacteria bacterium]|nr:glutathione S-transferase C-terminal domain-containing protein [Betaproteobacteria bacterium]